MRNESGQGRDPSLMGPRPISEPHFPVGNKNTSDKTADNGRRVLIDGIVFPKSVDINPTAKCNLNCRFCWGPDHAIPDGLSTNDWKDTIKLFARNGTDAIVFTGGEPLVRKDIGELMRFAKEQRMRVTLSTNTLLLEKKATDVLPFVDEIGIPIDGSTTENNAKMRIGNRRAFESSLSAMVLVRERYPGIEITVRTVVSKVNKDDVDNIARLLNDRRRMFDRWKLYQFTPVSIGSESREAFEISDDEFNDLTAKVIENFPNIPIVAYPSLQRVGKYVFVGPEGRIFGVDESGNYRTAGNLRDIKLGGQVVSLKDIYTSKINGLHAHRLTPVAPKA